jgi:predicted DNA-binding protein with PD1-like motif
MDYRTVKTTEAFVARFETGADWRTAIEALAREEGITIS